MIRTIRPGRLQPAHSATSRLIQTISARPLFYPILFLAIFSVVPKFYKFVLTFHLKKSPKQKPIPGPKPKFTLMSFFGVRSFVHTQASPESVPLPIKGDISSTKTLSELVSENIPALRDGAWDLMSPTLFNGNLQTMYAAGGFESINKVYYGRRCLYWDDGSLVTADYHIAAPTSQAEWKEKLEYCPLDNPPPLPSRLRYFTPEEINEIKNPKSSVADKPLLVLLHGLSGGSHESYIRSVVDMISQPEYDFDCVVLNSRGCARTPITTPQLFCAIWTEDIRRFIRVLRAEQPAERRIYLVGFSLGASILANFLGQEGELTSQPGSRVDAAMIVANPWDLYQSNQYLASSFMGRTVYSPVMAKNLLRLLKNHHVKLQENKNFDYEKRREVKMISDFDNQYTAPLFGFDTANDYYRNASSVHRLMNIRTPTVIINALDDPIVHEDCIPYLEAMKNPYVILSTTSLGGHIGWFQPGGKRWFPPVISEFFKSFDKIVDHEKGTPMVQVSRPERQLLGDRLKA